MNPTYPKIVQMTNKKYKNLYNVTPRDVYLGKFGI